MHRKLFVAASGAVRHKMEYSNICEWYYAGQHLPTNFGMDDHILERWEALPNLPIWTSTGSQEKPSRWFEWSRLFTGMQKYLGYFRFALLLMGLEFVWWPSIEKSPLMCDLHGKDLATDEDPAVEVN